MKTTLDFFALGFLLLLFVFGGIMFFGTVNTTVTQRPDSARKCVWD